MKDQDIIKVIKDNYRIDVKKIEKNEESTDGNVYVIEDGISKYVLKIYMSEKHTKKMVQLHKILESNNINAPRIVKSIHNVYFEMYEDSYYVVYSFIEGKKLKECEFEKSKIKHIAKYLKELHKLKVPEDCDLDTVKITNYDDKKSILHFDITKSNIFINNDEVFFIDFDDAKYGSAIFDIAIAVTNLFISRAHGADINGINYFINEYYDNDVEKIKQEIPKIKEAAIIWLNETLMKQHLSTSIKEGLTNKINWINKIWS